MHFDTKAWDKQVRKNTEAKAVEIDASINE